LHEFGRKWRVQSSKRKPKVIKAKLLFSNPGHGDQFETHLIHPIPIEGMPWFGFHKNQQMSRPSIGNFSDGVSLFLSLGYHRTTPFSER
jgi:hypothetical protein